MVLHYSMVTALVIKTVTFRPKCEVQSIKLLEENMEKNFINLNLSENFFR